MRCPPRGSRTTATILGALLLVGCGAEGPAGREISGNVSYQGTPLASGTIEFFAADEDQQIWQTTVAQGKYFVPAASGLMPGSYGVRIQSVVVRAARSEATDPVPQVVDIPAKYNTQTVLTAEVGEDAEQTINFMLE